MNNTVFITGLGFKSMIGKDIADILIDLPDISYSNSLLDNLEIINKFFNERIKPNSIIIGWSLGGLLAIYFAYLYPNRCSKLILISSIPKFSSSNSWPAIKNIFFDNRFPKLVQYPNRNKLVREIINDNYIGANTQYLRLLESIDLRKEYQNLEIPILHFFGDQDTIIPIGISEHLSKLNQNAKIRIIKGGCHAMFLTHANEIVYER